MNKKTLIILLSAWLLAAALLLSCCAGEAKPSETAPQTTQSIPSQSDGITESKASPEGEETPGEGEYAVTFDTGDEGISLPKAIVKAGECVQKPQITREGYVLRRWQSGGKTYDFSAAVTDDLTLTAEWMEGSNLPSMVIELYDDNGQTFSIDSVGKEEYVTSAVTVVNSDGSFQVDGASAGFRGRGNGSWNDAKKCFKIKFDRKQSLFGRAANKHWVLLACTNFSDGTLLRNYSAYTLAGKLFDGIEYVTNTEWIDLYVNGEYRGVYVLCEHVRVGDGRVDIESKYGVEDTGYLIEYDAYAEGVEGIDWFTINDEEGNGQGSKGGAPTVQNGIVKYHFTVHSPDPEDYAAKGKITEEEYRAQVSYIQDYVKRVYTAAIVDHDFETFCELADVKSLVDVYIMQELYKNTDAGYSSFYLYKKPGGKLYFGPLWDFDGTTTAARGEENNPNGIYVAGTVQNYVNDTDNELFIEMYKIPEFLELVKARWKELSEQISEYYESLFTVEFYEEYRYAVGRNFVRWSNSGIGGKGGGTKLTQEQAEKEWYSDCVSLRNWFIKRIAFLDKEWE